MLRLSICLVVAALLVGTHGAALSLLQPARVLDGLPLGEDLGLRMLSHSLLPEARLTTEPRLALPTPAELDAIAKVAQILVTLGQQVIPAIIGEPPAATSPPSNCDIPNDPVKE